MSEHSPIKQGWLDRLKSQPDLESNMHIITGGKE